MSDGICSDDERYGGFGASMANSLAAYGAAPARVVAAVTAARAPLPVAAAERVTAARAPLPVAATERVWLTKRPYKKRQKKSGMPAPAPQEAAAPAAPRHGEKVTPRPCCRAHCGTRALFVWRAHPSEWYCRRDRRNGDELPGPLVQGARYLRRGVEGGHCGAPP